ncbi:MAG: tetratricopeptide repeat protein [Bacteroidales bacterium]|nr:tetratricopeptide repeat protein [Bacteroidales bacterium]
MGDTTKALSYYQKASKMPDTYCFPFRAEEIDILESALHLNPTDAHAHYYLGNLLYEHQPEKAISLWEKARELNENMYIVHRNLGLAYKEVQKDYAKALASVEKAVACNNADPRLLYEVDALYDLNKMSPQKKYELLKKNFTTVKQRSETLLRLVTRSVEVGRYDEALNIMTNYAINESEGAREMQSAYLNCYTLRGMKFMKEGKFEKAISDIQKAMDYPIGLYGRSRYAQFNYLLGDIYFKMGNKDKANEYLNKTVEIIMDGGGADREYLYYRGMALKMLGKHDEAKTSFEKMLNDVLNKRQGNAFFTQFEGGQAAELQKATNQYLAGLAYEGLGEIEKAKEEYSETLKINPSHIWAKVHLDSIK